MKPYSWSFQVLLPLSPYLLSLQTSRSASSSGSSLSMARMCKQPRDTRNNKSMESYEKQLAGGNAHLGKSSAVARQNGTSQPEVTCSSGLTHGIHSDLQKEIVSLADSITFYLHSKSMNLNSKSGDEIPKHTPISLGFTSTACLWSSRARLQRYMNAHILLLLGQFFKSYLATIKWNLGFVILWRPFLEAVFPKHLSNLRTWVT